MGHGFDVVSCDAGEREQEVDFPLEIWDFLGLVQRFGPLRGIGPKPCLQFLLVNLVLWRESRVAGERREV